MIEPANPRKRIGRTVSARHAMLSLGLLLTACIPSAQSAEIDDRVAPPATPAALSGPVRQAALQPAMRPAPPPTPLVSQAELAAQRILDAKIRQLGSGFNGEVGIAVRDVQSGWTSHHNGTRYYPQQSVSKFWVALAALDAIDRGAIGLSERVTIRREDLTLFHQPIRAQVGANGYTTTLQDLMHRAITQSDNTANDSVLRTAGGPEAVRTMLARKELEGVRFGPGERLMQSHLAGLSWQPSYSIGNAFYEARSAVPSSVRRERFDSYVADPVDGVTPIGMVDGLTRLIKGELLSPSSTSLLVSTMRQTRTGPQRLTGGLAPGWRIAHKTGTGQVFGGAQTGYNDVGILTSPDGRHYSVAVLIGRTAVPIPERMQLMQSATRAVIAYHDNLR